MAARITTPVKGFTGQIVGVPFVDGIGETDDDNLLAYFRRHGYDVELDAAPPASAPVEVPAGDPVEAWTNAQIVAWAKAHDVDLGGATKKDDMLAVVATAIAARVPDAGTQPSS